MSRAPIALMLMLSTMLWLAGCPAEVTDGDGDSDSDADGDGGGDCETECCDDLDCSNGIFCDGVEVCDRGVCEPDPNSVCTPATGCRIVCDDGYECTDDQCDEMANVCVHEPMHDRCLDEDSCNGEERCTPADSEADDRGCVFGDSLVCDDDDDCTVDYCIDNECHARLRDSDGDGFGDEGCEVCEPDDPRDCERGTDCDDSNDEVYPGAPEICDDGEDNNCDRVRDYADAACDVPYDGCGSSLLLRAGERVHASTRGTRADVSSSCSDETHPDVVFAFNLTEVQDVEVTLEARGGRDLAVALTADCGNADADIKCTRGRAFTQISRSLEPGTYFVVVSGELEVDFDIIFDHSDPVGRPDGDQCTTAIDVTSGGEFSGSTTGFDADYAASCGEDTDRDSTFVFTLDETSAVDLEVVAGDDVSVAVQTTCGVPATEWACFEGDPAEGRVGSLAPGTYYVIVKSLREVDFTLDVSFSMTSADNCEAVRDISRGGAFYGTTEGLSADIDTACGNPLGPDSVYMFTLDETQDVTVDFASPGDVTTLSLTRECDNPESEVRCSTGERFQLRGRGLEAGTYYLVATGSAGAEFELGLSYRDPVARPDDDLCLGAIEIAGSGVYRGDTTDCENDYDSRCGSPSDLDTTYVFRLAEARSLELEVDADSGPITVALQPDCGVVGTERSCFTTEPGGAASRFYRSLDPGTYYLVFKTPSPDTFAFQATFGDAEPTLMSPWVDPSGHTAHAITDPWGMDDDQFNIEIGPLTFPFNGGTHGCVALSTNGYMRFGPSGSCPTASGFGSSDTDPGEAFGGGTAQLSWLGADGEAAPEAEVYHYVDTGSQQVIITFLGYHRLGGVESESNDVQIVLYCDTGDIQVSYGECAFDTGGWGSWGMGISEPGHGGTVQEHDFPGQDPGSLVSFGPGAVTQTPAHTDADDFMTLVDHAVFYQRNGTGWDILLDVLPL